MSRELPEGWMRWRGYSATVSTGLVGLVVTCPAGMQVVLSGAICKTDADSKAITIKSASTSVAVLDVNSEQRWLAPDGIEGPPGAAGEDMTVQISVTAAGRMFAWGYIRPMPTSRVYTSVAAL